MRATITSSLVKVVTSPHQLLVPLWRNGEKKMWFSFDGLGGYHALLTALGRLSAFHKVLPHVVSPVAWAATVCLNLALRIWCFL